MKKRTFVPARGVSNIELFYDLIFVYCISVITTTMHHVDGFFTWAQWAEFTFSYLVILQIWLFTTFLMNRYGEHSADDNVCLFVEMFLLYFLAHSIQGGWRDSVFTFNMAWALILANLIVHWAFKRLRYGNIDDVDKRIMTGIMIVLAIEMGIVIFAAFLPSPESGIASWVALFFGAAVFAQSGLYRRKPARFAHLVERCTLLTIIAFGETIVALATYMTESVSLEFSVLVFALVVGLFLIYIYERDNMTDHHKETDGMAYLTLTGWIILVIGNITVALEYMPMDDIDFVAKSAYLMVSLVLYLVTSFMLGYFNKPAFRYTLAYTVGRLGVCLGIVAVALMTNFNPIVNLVCDVVLVYAALGHEWMLYRRRTAALAFGNSILGSDADDD